MKDFINWFKKKNYLHSEKTRPNVSEREIWFCSLGENIGFEQDGRGNDFARPCLILKKFNKEVCWIVPVTRNKKIGKYYLPISTGDIDGSLILSQLKLVDIKRCLYKSATLQENSFNLVKEKITQLLA